MSLQCSLSTCAGEHWPVDADGTEVEDGGGAQHHVHGHQIVTDVGAEGPHAILELKNRDMLSTLTHTSGGLMDKNKKKGTSTQKVLMCLWWNSYKPFSSM